VKEPAFLTSCERRSKFKGRLPISAGSAYKSLVDESAFHPEDRARSLIDRRLVACGWLIQSKADMNLGAGLGVAVREFQTASGPVDYGLFVGRKLCGVIEAKPEGTTLSGFSEQAARYIADVPKHLVP
jgi:type I restriction enzyme, R subunit